MADLGYLLWTIRDVYCGGFGIFIVDDSGCLLWIT